MIPDVWITRATPAVTFDDGTPGSHWELAGTVDTAQEADLRKNLQMLLGLARSAPPLPGFYLSGDPESSWVQAAKQDPAGQSPFWIAIDPWGRMRASIHNARETYFVSNAMATAAKSLGARRTPQPHPGMAGTAVIIGIKVTRKDGGLFTPRVHE